MKCLLLAATTLIGTWACGGLQQDLQSLREFRAAYDAFDHRVSDFSARANESNERGADKALTDLALAASLRLSSSIKNDGAMMRTVREVSNAATQELTSLKE